MRRAALQLERNGEMYIPLREARRITGYGDSNIFRLCKTESPDTGRPYVRRLPRGRTWLYSKTDLEQYLMYNCTGYEEPTQTAVEEDEEGDKIDIRYNDGTGQSDEDEEFEI